MFPTNFLYFHLWIRPYFFLFSNAALVENSKNSVYLPIMLDCGQDLKRLSRIRDYYKIKTNNEITFM